MTRQPRSLDAVQNLRQPAWRPEAALTAQLTGRIGAVTRLLQDHLIRRGFDVSVGKPEEAAQANTNAKLNLFLYETGFDPHLRNVELRHGEPPPLWLILKYLLTAFDAGENSDSADAHELLGRGIAALHELSLLRLVPPVIPSVQAALQDNPEPLKLSFDETTAELISKIMQGTDERYRLSMAFQVRPVMIVPASPSHSTLLVGDRLHHGAADDDRRGRRGDRRHPVDGPDARSRRAGGIRSRRVDRDVRQRPAWREHRGRARRPGADDRRARGPSACS